MNGEATYYDGWRGTLRLLRELFVEDVPQMLREDAKNAKAKLTNEASTGESCKLKDCGKQGVSMFDPPKRYDSEFSVCRRHWLSLKAAKALALLLVYGVPVALTVAVILLL